MNSSRKEYLMEFLNGSFLLKRNISKPEIEIVGNAKFYSESENSISYYEHGNYFLGGVAHEFYQKRYFIFDSQFLKILNSSKEIMHAVIPSFLSESECRFSHTHICKNDEYLLDFMITDNVIYMDYKITGPNKNYSIKTRLEKSKP